MPSESASDVKLEIAHALCIDIVGYSKLLLNEQRILVDRLNQIVRRTDAFGKAEAAGRLIKIPTGDGMVLVFYDSPEAPVQCALEISRALKEHPELQVRMGVHSGPVSAVVDVNEKANVAGAGINMAQRVMDCGDAGHILLSRHVAEDLETSGQWKPLLHELGECEVKHGVRLSVFNLFTDDAGNRELPSKLREQQDDQASTLRTTRKKRQWKMAAIAALVVAIIAAVLTPFLVRRNSSTGAALLNSIPEKSIAVLPFENLSANQENAFFTDGVQSEILTDLARVADLKVISQTSVMQYKNAAKRNLREIAAALGVAHVLEGSVQRASNKIRVNAQLIDARNDSHLWAQTYDRELVDVFAIQSEIAKTIAEQLQARLSPTEQAAIAQPPTTDLVAYDLYLRARALTDLSNDPGAKSSLLQAVSLLEEAVSRDPKFLLAYCLLCETHLDLFWGGFDHTPARREQANAALQQAERIQSDAGEVHVQKGIYAYHGFRDYDRGRAEFELALRTLPNASRIYLQLGAIDRRQARWDEAVRSFHRAAELDPRNFVVLEETGFTHTGLRQFAEGKTWYERALAISPKDYLTRTELSQLPYYERADTRPWRSQLNAILREGKDAASHVVLASINCAQAERDRKAADEALALVPAEGTVNPYDNSLVPREFLVGTVARSFGDESRAQQAFTDARAIVAQTLQNLPEYAPAWSMLGIIDAGLGRKADAIAEGKRACELLPVSKDAWDGFFYVTNLALIYTWTGEKDLALEQLATSARTPAGIVYGELKLNPAWDTLRDDPRFEEIVNVLAPKGASSK